jgi:transcriptional repressor NrdR
MRCPWCANLDDKVVDSRAADDGSVIRRRRECLSCGRRYTSFERVEDVALTVVKRSGERQPFERAKVLAGLRAATKNLGLSDAVLDDIATQVEEDLRVHGPETPSEQVGLLVLERLRTVDGVAYLRFASVYKNFTDPGDFAREATLLKATAPKPAKSRSGDTA